MWYYDIILGDIRIVLTLYLTYPQKTQEVEKGGKMPGKTTKNCFASKMQGRTWTWLAEDDFH